MLKTIRNSYLLLLQKLPVLLLLWLPILLIETMNTAVDKDQISGWGFLGSVLIMLLKIEMLLVVYTYLLDGKLKFGYAPGKMFKLFILDFVISLVAVGPSILVFYLLDVTFVEVSLPSWLYDVAMIATVLYTLWVLPRLSLLFPQFIKGECLSPKTWWTLTSDKNWRWFLAGIFICGPDILSRFWSYNTYAEVIWSNLVILIPVCFSVVYYQEHSENKVS